MENSITGRTSRCTYCNLSRLICKYQELYYTFIESLLIRNVLYCRRTSINSFITHCFESYSNWRQIVTHVQNYQQFYYTFFDFCSSQEQTLTFHHFLKQFHYTVFILLSYYICCYKWQLFDCIFTHCFSLKAIRSDLFHFRTFFIASILILKVLWLSWLYSLSKHFTYLRKSQRKSVLTTAKI